MGLKLEIELERLREPAVAAAVARLIEVLGGGAPVPATAPAARPAPAPVAPAPVAAPAPVEVAEPAPRKAPEPQVEPAPLRILPDPPELSPRERYIEFVEQLPQRSRDFLDLVRRRKLLKISDAMRELEIDAPKAMGGLTGSIGRWAPLRGVQIPYIATTEEGERAWRWIGGPGADEDEDGPSAPPERLLTILKDAGHDKSVQFLELLYERGALERGEVLQALGLAAPKSMGGVTEPVNRAVRDLGLPAAFVPAKNAENQRMWLAPGAPVPAGVSVDA